MSFWKVNLKLFNRFWDKEKVIFFSGKGAFIMSTVVVFFNLDKCFKLMNCIFHHQVPTYLQRTQVYLLNIFKVVKYFQ